MADIWATYPSVPTSTALPPSQPTVTVIPDTDTYELISNWGQNTLWATFAIMVLSSIGFTVLAWRVPVQKRLFYQLTTFITLIAAISYYAMASNGGWYFQKYWKIDEHKHDIPNTDHFVHRQVYYARYVDWLFTTPLLLLDLALLAGLNGSNILNIIVADVVMIMTGLFAAFSHHHRQKWGWYIIAWIAFLVIIAQLAINARATASKRGASVQKLYVPLAVYTVVIWFAYPIIWAVSEGKHKLSVNQEVLAYAFLDILAKPVFGAALLLAHRRAPEIALNIDGAWSEGLGQREGTLRVGDDDEA